MYSQDNQKSFSPDENSEIIISKALLKKKRQNKKMSAYYSFLTIVLLFCLAQITFSAVLNISKVISYRQKIFVMKNTQKQVLSRNDQLKTELGNFSSSSSWEAIARNNLKMAGDNEILIIIDENKPEPTIQENKKQQDKKNGKKKHGKQ